MRFKKLTEDLLNGYKVGDKVELANGQTGTVMRDQDIIDDYIVVSIDGMDETKYPLVDTVRPIYDLREDASTFKFQEGDILEWSGLYGGQYRARVKSIRGDVLTVTTSWIAEDTGETIFADEKFMIEQDEAGNDCIVVWTYHGDVGRVYPPAYYEQSFTEEVKKPINETYWINNKEVMDEVEKLGQQLESEGFKYYCDKYSGSAYYNFFTKRGDDGAICKAVQYNYNGAQIIDVTVNQVMGYEAIDSFESMRRKLGKMLLPQNESVEGDKEEDQFVLYFPYLEPKIVSKDRAIKQMEFELNEFKNNSGASVAGRGFGIYCLQSYDPDTDSVWTGRYSSKEFLKVLDESMLREAFDTTRDFPHMFFYNCNNPTFGYDFQLFASSLGARKVYGRYKGTGAGTYFYLVPSEEVYEKLKAVAKDKYTVEMQRLLPYDAEKYPKIQYIKESLNEDSDEDIVWPIGPNTLTFSGASRRLAALRSDIKLLMNCDTAADVKAHAKEFQMYNCANIIERKMVKGMSEADAIDSTETYLMNCLNQWKSDMVKFRDDAAVAMKTFNTVKNALSQYELISADEERCVLKYRPIEGAAHKDCIEFVDAVVAAVNGKYNFTGRGGSWTRWDIRTADGVILKAGWDDDGDTWSVTFPRLKFENFEPAALNEDLEDELDILLRASDLKCKLSRYDIEEAANFTHLIANMEKTYNDLVAEYGAENIKWWKFYEDDDVDFGYKVCLIDGSKKIVEINDGKVEEVNESITEAADEQRYVICGITNEGTRMLYDAVNDNFTTDYASATKYTDMDVARNDWFMIPRNGFRRIFIPVYDPAIFEEIDESSDVDKVQINEGTGADTRRLTSDALKLAAEGDKREWANTASKVVDLIPDSFADDLFDAIKEKFSDIRLNAEAKKKIADSSDGNVTEEQLEDSDTLGKVLELFDSFEWAKKNPALLKSFIVVVLGILAIVEQPLPVLELVTSIVLLVPDDIVAKIFAFLNTTTVVGMAGHIANQLYKKSKNEDYIEDDELETDYRYYVYNDSDNVVSDAFDFDEDAIEWAKENNYPVVKIHNYYRDLDGQLNPDGDPEVIWEAE